MNQWPYTIPEDLRKSLDDVMRNRSYGSADLWGEIRDWLVKHEIEPPDHRLPEYQPPVR